MRALNVALVSINQEKNPHKPSESVKKRIEEETIINDVNKTTL